MNNYFIKENYTANTIPFTDENISENNYWNESRVKASRYYQYSIYNDVAKIANKYRIASICDVGCGTGEKLKLVHSRNSDLNIFGVDQSHAIDYCLNNHDFGNWIIDDLSNPLQAISVDMAMCCDVIEHLVNPDILIRYLMKITVPGGLILLSTPDRDRVRGVNCNYSPNKQHIREWNFSEFSNYLKSHGLIIQEHYHSLPVKFSLNKFFLNELFWSILLRRNLNYNQVVILKNRG